MKRGRQNKGGSNSFKALFISDPDRSEIDAAALNQLGSDMGDKKLVNGVLQRKVTTFDRVMEIFSTHPNIVKRLRTLQELD